MTIHLFRATRELRNVLVFAAARYLGGLLVALPPVSVIQSSGIGALPNGDASLFEPGGLLLVELARLHGTAFLQALKSSLPLLCVVGALLLIPMARLLASLLPESGHEKPRVGAACFGRLLLLSLITWLAGLALVAVVVAVGAAVLEIGEPCTNCEVAVWAGGGVLLLLALKTMAILQDLARAFVVRDAARPTSALRGALLSFRRRPLSACGVAVGIGAAGAVWLAAGAAGVGAVDISEPGAWRPWASFAVHLACIFGLTWLRAVWLSYAASLTELSSRQALAASA